MDEGARTVAGWVLERRLGAGGFGEVWQARRRHVGLPRALKLLPIRDQRAFTSWRHEIDRLEELSHPHIVRFYDADVVADPASPYDGFAWIATELCQRSLADDLDGRASRVLDDEECVALADQLLDALASAHGRSCVHRDVKPANILWHASGVWKLADFGTARLVPDGAHHAQTTVVGTVPYMSPAAHRGQQDYAADLYALGVTVQEALCGELLHRRPGRMSDSEYIKLILDTPPRISSTLDVRWRTVVAALIGSYGPVGAADLLAWFRRTGGVSGPPPVGASTAPVPAPGPHSPASPPAVGADPSHLSPPSPSPASGTPAWWDDAAVRDTNVEHVPGTARRPATSRPGTSPVGGLRSGRTRGHPQARRRHERDVPVGPLVVFGASSVLATVLLYAAVPNAAFVLGVVGGAVLVILLIMALN
jgi:eukaryotic-like serine/threonine-protein kinase